MRIKIVEPGWEGFSDMLGMVQFKNCVSVEDVPQLEIDRISAMLKVVEYREDGQAALQLGFAAESVRNKNLPSPDEHKPLQRGQPTKEGDSTKPSTEIKFYTTAELGAIADEKGIEGLREIAKPLGVAAKSIQRLIALIMQKQDVLKAVARQREKDKATQPAVIGA